MRDNDCSSILQRWASEYRSAMYRAAHRRVRCRQTAEDCVQEAFLRACRQGDKILAIENPRAWLFTVLRNIVKNTYRGPKVALVPLDACYSLSSSDADHTSRMMVARALDDLPDDLRELIELSYHWGFTNTEIADITGLKVGTVKSRLYHARERLEQAGTLTM